MAATEKKDPNITERDQNQNEIKKENRSPRFIIQDNYRIIITEENQDPDQYRTEIKEENQDPDFTEQDVTEGNQTAGHRSSEPAGPSEQQAHKASPHNKKRKASALSPGLGTAVRLFKKKASTTISCHRGSAKSPQCLEELRAVKQRLNAVEARQVCGGCAGLETQLEETRGQLETMRKSLGQIEARLEQRLSSPPAPPNELTAVPSRPSAGPSHPSCGCQQFPTLAESPAEEEPLPLSSLEESASPASPSAKTPVQPPQEVTLRALSAEREDAFFKDCFVQGEPRPDVYAANMFMALTPFEAYTSWVKRINWSGSNGKAALPQNLKEKIHEYVTHRFPDLSTEQWHRIRNKINERLRSSRKIDPEMPRAGFTK